MAYWASDLKPDDDGIIEIEVDAPENLTTWKICAWTVGDGLRVGSGESEIITSKDVIVRMQKPRFLTQKDEVVLSANVHNYLDSEKKVRVSLEFPKDEAENSTAELVFLNETEPTREIVVPANAEARVDWLVRADKAGVATLLMKALTNEDSDAIQETIRVQEHGIDKQIAVSGVIPPEKREDTPKEQVEPKVRESSFTLVVPEERREETTRLTVRFSPSLAGAIFDALPYLMEYPYGCTEQTLNKFLPLIATQRALMDSGVDLEKIGNKIANLNAQELGDASERAEQWKRIQDKRSVPIFDLKEARAMTESGIAKLESMQNLDAGWGWFAGDGSRSTARMTALAARGLVQAKRCDYAVDDQKLASAAQWLLNYQREETLKIIRGKVWTNEQKREPDAWNKWKSRADSTDADVFYALVELGVYASEFQEIVDYDKAELTSDDPLAIAALMKELVWEARADLQLSALASFAIALASQPTPSDDDKIKVENILALLSQYRKVDDENQTVWLDLSTVPNWFFWTWYGDEYETQAYYLTLLQRVDDATLEKLGLKDDASRLVKYLLNNRKNASYWRSTRDTALCVQAFSEYLCKTNELAPNEKVDVLIDGELKKTIEFTPDNIFDADGTVVLAADELSAGEHVVVLRAQGDGALYYNAYLEFFTLEDPIEKTGLEVKVERRYYKLVEKKDATASVEGGRGQVVTQRVERYERVALDSGAAVTSGDLVEVELLVDSKNDYESVIIEDLKSAGFEATEQRSGYNGNELGAYVEYRDDRVCFFAERLPQGRSVLKYQLRAETPGRFSALPAKIWAMYAPELKGNADEFKTKVDDRDDL